MREALAPPLSRNPEGHGREEARRVWQVPPASSPFCLLVSGSGAQERVGGDVPGPPTERRYFFYLCNGHSPGRKGAEGGQGGDGWMPHSHSDGAWTNRPESSTNSEKHT